VVLVGEPIWDPVALLGRFNRLWSHPNRPDRINGRYLETNVAAKVV